VSDRHGRLLHFRVQNQSRVIVNLPAPASRGDELTLTVSYAGRLEPQGLARENLQVEPETPAQPRFLPPLLILQPEPAWIYSTRSDWYPQNLSTDYATATIRIDVPRRYGAACSGVPAPGSPDAPIEAGEGQRRFVFTVTRPVRYLACLVSTFRDAEDRTLRLPADRAPSAAAAGSGGRHIASSAERDSSSR
jgi:hypothetical protein